MERKSVLKVVADRNVPLKRKLAAVLGLFNDFPHLKEWCLNGIPKEWEKTFCKTKDSRSVKDEKKKKIRNFINGGLKSMADCYFNHWRENLNDFARHYSMKFNSDRNGSNDFALRSFKQSGSCVCPPQ